MHLVLPRGWCRVECEGIVRSTRIWVSGSVGCEPGDGKGNYTARRRSFHARRVCGGVAWTLMACGDCTCLNQSARGFLRDIARVFPSGVRFS